MSHSISHTIRLQDGTACNLNTPSMNCHVSLSSLLADIPDPRKRSGRRHPLVLILLIVFIALLRGSKDLKDAVLFARLNQDFFRGQVGVALPHGIPDPTTISRLLGRLDLEKLVGVHLLFLQALNITQDDAYSYDGKTMRAVSGTGTVRHILSLFSQGSHVALGQVGVTGKGREIPAFEQLLKQGQANTLIAGKLLLGDALHTQKATVKAILKANADYLFVVKGNQKQLGRAIQAALAGSAENHQCDCFTGKDTTRGRNVITVVTTLQAGSSTDNELLPGLTGSNHWDGVRTIGILHRTGTRPNKESIAHSINETVGFISSRTLSAEAAAVYLRGHWCVENNLHWTKDVVFGEDKHTLRRGNAPQVMSWLRSMVISLCNALKLHSISDTIHNLEKSTVLLGKFLEMAGVI
jgi:predicted transposase YbfD/YdcC